MYTCRMYKKTEPFQIKINYDVLYQYWLLRINDPQKYMQSLVHIRN